MNYFMHTGHMHIKGHKMSKSLKNFIIIRKIIKTVTPRILRLSYNLVNYDSILNYDKEDDFSYARAIDKKFKNFF